MNLNLIVSGPVGILPVLLFLQALQYLDSFKLVRLKFIVSMIVAGGSLAGLAYYLNGILLELLDIEFLTYARYCAPAIEEGFKASVLVFLFKTHRIGFLVDSAIIGFALGTGFAVVENFYYLYVIGDANLGVWIVRGFGTAIMHGGTTAIFAIISVVIIETEDTALRNYAPGLLLAIIIHSAFNHFFFSPIFSTLAIIVILPPLMYLVFQKSNGSLHDWLELDFDADADLIQQLDSGEFESTHVGVYLKDLRERFDGLIIVDMLCFLRIYTELSMRAKGAMMMRKHGMEMPHDETIEASFDELRHLENNIGRSGMLTIEPFLEIDRRDLWHLNALEQTHG